MDLQIIPSKEIQRGKKLGEGGFGIVFAGTWNGHQVAIKTLRLSELSEELEKEFTKEAKVMASLNHPAIIHLYGICKEKNNYAMIIDYLPRGDLYKLLQDKKQALPWNPLRWQLAIDIGGGLTYLHKCNILHRDLKSLNILLDQNLRAKITDFGLSKLKLHTKSTYSQHTGGSIPWMAPELFQRNIPITKASDVYAYGMILWELSSRKLPFADAHNADVIPTWIVQGEREDIPKDCPTSIADTIQKCWSQNPKDRPTIQVVLETLTQARPQPIKAPPITTQATLQNTPIISPLPKKSVSGAQEYHIARQLIQRCKYQEALFHLKKAANAKYPPSFLRLRQLYNEGGYIGPQNETKTERYYDQAVTHFKWFEEQANTKEAHAQVNLGICYKLGCGTEKNNDLAYKYFQLAADQNDPDGQYLAGKCHFTGQGTKQDRALAKKLIVSASQQNHPEALHFLATQFYPLGDKAMCSWHQLTKLEYEKQAIKHLSQACDLGFAKSMPYLAEYYLYGFGSVLANPDKAREIFVVSAKKGVSQSQAWLAKCYLTGRHSIKKDLEQAFNYFRSAHNQGERFTNSIFNSNYELGHELLKDCKFREALPCLNKAANEKYPAAYLLLTWLHSRSGRVGPANLALANKWKAEAGTRFSWFKEQAKTEDPQALCNLAHCYYYGHGTPRDVENALRFYREAAKKGNADAPLHLGHCHRYGHGVLRDKGTAAFLGYKESLAISNYSLSADRGNPEAMVILGKFWWGKYLNTIYGHGFGPYIIKKHKDKVIFYFQRAINKGYADGQFYMGLSYEEGWGHSKDMNQAKKYFQMAADQGHAMAKARLESCSIM